MEQPKVSVIIPAYNAEATIEASVRCILGQSYRELELIVIDDGSRDGTADILAALAEEDSRLKPLTVPNGGPAAARNRALELMDRTSRYVLFSDADDLMLPDAVEYAVGEAEASFADLVIFGFSIVNADGTKSDYCEPFSRMSREGLKKGLETLYKANLLNQVWGKLFRADLIMENGIRFADYRWGEDRLFIYDCLEKLEKLSVLPECKYQYLMHPGESLITRYYDKKFSVCLRADDRMEELCRQFGVEEQGYFRYMFVKSVFSCFTNLFSPTCGLSRREKRQYVRTVLRSGHYMRRSRNVSGGAAVKLLCAVTHTRSVGLTLFTFRAVSAVGRIAPKFFQKIKHKK